MRFGFIALILAAGVVAGMKVFGGAAADHHRADTRSATALAEAATSLPAPATPAFSVGQPRLLNAPRATARFATVSRSGLALAAPHAGSDPIATLDAQTEEGTTNVVLVVAQATTNEGAWVHIRLPVLPNGRTGWVRRSALGGYRFVHTRLLVDRTKLTATLFKNGRPIFHAPVGVGTPAAPTPAGEFYVRLKLAGFNDPFYGPVAYGTNARSTVLTDWPGGGYIGIHGTNMPELVPGRVSHGCIRMRNEDILKLSALMPVGTPLIVR
jgi:lipoprotein-anchoring transpeptidase ErfK/SrfK